MPSAHPGENVRSRVETRRCDVSIPPAALSGSLVVPKDAAALILFAHGSGSGRLSPRNRRVAEELNARRMATLLLDLLRPEEEENRRNVFDIGLLSDRLIQAVRWTEQDPELAGLPLGLFGASTGAAAALIVAARLGRRVGAVVSRGGRPDLADAALPLVAAPTLLIVGGADTVVIELNERAIHLLAGEKALRLVPGATHLFEERGALEDVAEMAGAWFERHLCHRSAGHPDS